MLKYAPIFPALFIMLSSIQRGGLPPRNSQHRQFIKVIKKGKNEWKNIQINLLSHYFQN